MVACGPRLPECHPEQLAKLDPGVVGGRDLQQELDALLGLGEAGHVHQLIRGSDGRECAAIEERHLQGEGALD